MGFVDLSQQAEEYLQKLCVEIPNRRVGSEGNRAATDFFASIAASFGFEVETPVFDCIDWMCEGVDLAVGERAFQAFASPYSPGCHVRAPLAVVSSVEALEAAEISGSIILLHGEIASQQLMPKNFPFYNPDGHKRIIQLLESKNPRAIIAATSRDMEMVGSMYPFPLIEDGDFDIPSVYMTDEEGKSLAAYAGKEILLESRATRIPASGCNVIARKRGRSNRRIVLFAHIDAKMNTPGASDNASGVIVLLLLAQLLKGYTGNTGIEIAAINGEDYFSNPGEQQYIALNEGKFDEIILGINIDGAGYYRGNTAYTLYDCPPPMVRVIDSTFSCSTEFVQGECWYQGDHGIFLLNQRPALAITSELAAELMAEITHTPKDCPEIIDTRKLATLALVLRETLLQVNHAVA